MAKPKRKTICAECAINAKETLYYCSPLCKANDCDADDSDEEDEEVDDEELKKHLEENKKFASMGFKYQDGQFSKYTHFGEGGESNLTFWELLEVLSKEENARMEQMMKDPAYIRRYEMLKGRKAEKPLIKTLYAAESEI